MKEITQRICKKHGLTEYVAYGNTRFKCRRCCSEQTVERCRQYKAELVVLFGGKCVICGYAKCKRSLHFHHLDRSTKEFGLGFSGNFKSKKRLLEEAKKCILVCANCHGEIEDGLTDVSRFKPAIAAGKEDSNGQ